MTGVQIGNTKADLVLDKSRFVDYCGLVGLKTKGNDMKTYHVGLAKGGHYHGGRESTLIVQLRRSVDFLSCELWKYLGQRETTKARLKACKAELLDTINVQYGTAFTRIVID